MDGSIDILGLELGRNDGNKLGVFEETPDGNWLGISVGIVLGSVETREGLTALDLLLRREHCGERKEKYG